MKSRHIIAAILSVLLVLGAVTGNLVYANKRSIDDIVLWEHHYEKIGTTYTRLQLYFTTYWDDSREIVDVTFPEFQLGDSWGFQKEFFPFVESAIGGTRETSNNFYKTSSFFITLMPKSMLERPEGASAGDDSQAERELEASIKSRQVITYAVVSLSDGSTKQLPLGKIVLMPYETPKESFWGLEPGSDNCFRPGNMDFRTGTRRVSVGQPLKNTFSEEIEASSAIQFIHGKIENDIYREHTLNGEAAANQRTSIQLDTSKLNYSAHPLAVYNVDVLYPLKNDKGETGVLPVTVTTYLDTPDNKSVTAMLKERGILS